MNSEKRKILYFLKEQFLNFWSGISKSARRKKMKQNNQQSNSSVSVQAHISAKKTNILSIVSLVFALLSLIATWATPVITEVVAIICGHIARSQIKKSQGYSREPKKETD